jgi:prepilin-type N-terminal cleavage/methylation domain-containing protein
MLHAGHRPQDGFTLIEVLMVVTITGMIMGAIAVACFVGIRTTTDQQRSLHQSNAEQLIAHWFVADVQAACDPGLSSPTCARSPDPSTASGSACGTTALFAIDSFSSATASAADTTVAYVLQNSLLSRLSCPYGSASTASTVPLAANVRSAAVSYPASGSCVGQFQLALTVAGTTLGNGTSDYTFTLCAQRRA